MRKRTYFAWEASRRGRCGTRSEVTPRYASSKVKVRKVSYNKPKKSNKKDDGMFGFGLIFLIFALPAFIYFPIRSFLVDDAEWSAEDIDNLDCAVGVVGLIWFIFMCYHIHDVDTWLKFLGYLLALIVTVVITIAGFYVQFKSKDENH